MDIKFKYKMRLFSILDLCSLPDIKTIYATYFRSIISTNVSTITNRITDEHNFICLPGDLSKHVRFIIKIL